MSLLKSSPRYPGSGGLTFHLAGKGCVSVQRAVDENVYCDLAACAMHLYKYERVQGFLRRRLSVWSNSRGRRLPGNIT